MDAYWKYQAEKKLYAIYDAFAQNNGHLNVSDARYINALKIFLTAVSPAEFASSNGLLGRGVTTVVQVRALRRRCSQLTNCATTRRKFTQ